MITKKELTKILICLVESADKMPEPEKSYDEFIVQSVDHEVYAIAFEKIRQYVYSLPNLKLIK